MTPVCNVDVAIVHWLDAWRVWYAKEPPAWRMISHWKWKKSFPRLEDFEHESGQSDQARKGTP